MVDGKQSNKPVIRGKGKGKALNQIAAASGRDPAAIVKSVAEAEKSAKERSKKEADDAAAKAIAEQQQDGRGDDSEVKDDTLPAQLYASLSPSDQYKFECFRRCGFAAKPMERFIAKVLVQEAAKRYLVRH